MKAKGTRHNEECQERLYHEMREAGVERLKRADTEDSARTQSQTEQKGRKAVVPIDISDAPMETLEIEAEGLQISPPMADDDTLRDDLDT